MSQMTTAADRFPFTGLNRQRKERTRGTPATGARGNTVVESKTQYDSETGDEALLIAVSHSQDALAFNQLFQRFSQKIYLLGMKLTRNEQLSRDLVQEAMMMVWKKAPLYDLDRGSAQSWIFTIARNRCFDLLRKIKRQPNTISADDIWPDDSEYELEDTSQKDAAYTLEVDQIEAQFDRLPAAQREVMEQIYINDLTHEEAARVLDIPLGTLKSRLRLGLGKLRSILEVEEE